MEHSIEKYSLRGNLYVWEFKEKNPNIRWWNFTADKVGCDSFLQLLQLMSNSKFPSRKRINTSTLTDTQIAVPNNRNSQWRHKNIIDLKYLKSEDGV
jgi:hypothetical protein